MDDFDQYCSWARKPNEFIEQYQARTLGSYEVLDKTDDESDFNVLENQSLEEENNLLRNEYNDQALDNEMNLCRIRSFKRTHKGVINQGDTVKNYSLLSLNLPTRSKSFTKGENPFRFGYTEKSAISSPEENQSVDLLVPQNFRINNETTQTTFEIFIAGKNGVGKTALCEQFLSSETYEFYSNTSSSDKAIRQVTVNLDDCEWNLVLHDFDDPTMLDSIEMCPDAYIIVYSIEDKDSFDWCTQILQNLEALPTAALFIVANKSDLERLRQVSSEKGKRLSSIYDAEFYEVSTILNHMVDNLLVQIIMKIRRHKKKLTKAKNSATKYSIKHKKSTPGNMFMDFFRRLSKAF